MRKLILVLIFVITVPVVHGQAGDLAAIQGRLNSQFKLTTTTADRSDIVTAVDVVVIHKPGLLMYAVASPMPPSNSYKNGKIGQGWGGFGKDMMITMATPGVGTAANYPHRPFVPEGKCWITGIQVQKDGVLFQLYSDPYDDIRYYSNLKIPFPNKKEVPSVDAAVQLVAEVLTVVAPDNQGEQQAQESTSGPATNSAQDGQEATIPGKYISKGTGTQLILLPGDSYNMIAADGHQSPGHYSLTYGPNKERAMLSLTPSGIGGSAVLKIQGDMLVDRKTREEWVQTGNEPATVPEAAPAPMPAIAPPPRPADTPPPTIAIGQTMDQVTAGFGQPLKLAKLGVKAIFYYKDMKVTFTNGKVSDVE